MYFAETFFAIFYTDRYKICTFDENNYTKQSVSFSVSHFPITQY